jgi:hypothetical protein
VERGMDHGGQKMNKTRDGSHQWQARIRGSFDAQRYGNSTYRWIPFSSCRPGSPTVLYHSTWLRCGGGTLRRRTRYRLGPKNGAATRFRATACLRRYRRGQFDRCPDTTGYLKRPLQRRAQGSRLKAQFTCFWRTVPEHSVRTRTGQAHQNLGAWSSPVGRTGVGPRISGCRVWGLRTKFPLPDPGCESKARLRREVLCFPQKPCVWKPDGVISDVPRTCSRRGASLSVR